MKMYEIPEFVMCNPDTVIQFMTTSTFLGRPFVYCCSVKELYSDWANEANCCPENGDVVLMCTFYTDGKAYPIKSIGLDENNDFENLMRKIEEGITKYFKED